MNGSYDDWKTTEPEDEGPTHRRRTLTDCAHEWCICERVPGEDYCQACLVLLSHKRDRIEKGTAA